MARSRLALAASVLAVATIGTALYVNAGSLTPPAGPVAPTMKTLDQLSAEIAAIQSGGGIKRVVRGVVDIPKDMFEATQAFSPAVDPAKSVVVLSDSVSLTTPPSGTDPNWASRQGACVMSLTSTAITVRADINNANAAVKISYQIIEYN